MCIWFIDEMLSVATTPGLSGRTNNGNEGVGKKEVNTSQSNITGALPLDIVQCHKQHTTFFAGEGIASSQRRQSAYTKLCQQSGTFSI